MEQPWDTFINSLSPNFVKRTVQVTSGNYISESLSDLSFSNGDIITIVDLVTEIKADVYELGSEKKTKTTTIPPTYKGLFQLIPDPEPFVTVGDLMQCVRVAEKKEMCPLYKNQVSLYSAGKKLGVKEMETLALVSIEERGKEKYLRCRLTKRQLAPFVTLPASCVGMFCECQDDGHYNIDTIARWKLVKGRKRRIKPSAGFHDCRIIPHANAVLVLHPSFEVHAVLEGGEEMFLPTDLDISVVDFPGIATPQALPEAINLNEIYNLPEKAFPLSVRIVDIMDNSSGHWLQSLNGQCLEILKKEIVQGYFICEESEMPHKRGCFFVPDTYQGMVKKRVRDFRFVYDVVLAITAGRQIHFMAFRDYRSEHSHFHSFRSGDTFRTIKTEKLKVRVKDKLQNTEALLCEHINTKYKVWLPFHAEGQFKELLNDRTPYTMMQIASMYPLPCAIKVVMPDPSLPDDPICGIPKLRIDKASTEPCLVAQHMESSGDGTIRLLVDQFKMQVCIADIGTKKSKFKVAASLPPFNIMEIPETQYLSVVHYEDIELPPPLPPKNYHLSGGKKMISSDHFPFPPPIPPHSYSRWEVHE
ncbi:protein THEMIS3-like [Ambystoma mexicanum]|uniref:protein THEMIS3-like n=1 Tax=Ambystoma mexicanum TaxID=8296 RepID=UPI0037E72A6D